MAKVSSILAGQHDRHYPGCQDGVGWILALLLEVLVEVIDLEDDLLSSVLDGSKIMLAVGIIGGREGGKEPDLLKDF